MTSFSRLAILAGYACVIRNYFFVVLCAELFFLMAREGFFEVSISCPREALGVKVEMPPTRKIRGGRADSLGFF